MSLVQCLPCPSHVSPAQAVTILSEVCNGWYKLNRWYPADEIYCTMELTELVESFRLVSQCNSPMTILSESGAIIFTYQPMRFNQVWITFQLCAIVDANSTENTKPVGFKWLKNMSWIATGDINSTDNIQPVPTNCEILNRYNLTGLSELVEYCQLNILYVCNSSSIESWRPILLTWFLYFQLNWWGTSRYHFVHMPCPSNVLPVQVVTILSESVTIRMTD